MLIDSGICGSDEPAVEWSSAIWSGARLLYAACDLASDSRPCFSTSYGRALQPNNELDNGAEFPPLHDEQPHFAGVAFLYLQPAVPTHDS